MKQNDATRNAALLVLLVVALAILTAVYEHQPARPSDGQRKGPPVTHQGP